MTKGLIKGCIVGFGIGILLVLGLLLLGPKRLYALLGHVTRAKAQFEEAIRGLKSQLTAEFDAAHRANTDASHELDGDQ
jgi:Sec-independent protein translocase protein TatA